MSFELRSKKIGVYSTSCHSSFEDRKVSKSYLDADFPKKEVFTKSDNLNGDRSTIGSSDSRSSRQKGQRKILPRPSSTKLDQIFKFNYALSQRVNSAKNEQTQNGIHRPSSSAKHGNEKKSNYSQIKSDSCIVNQFGFRKPSIGNSTESSNLKPSNLGKGKTHCPRIFHRNTGFVLKSNKSEDNLKHGTGIACLSVLKKRRNSIKKAAKPNIHKSSFQASNCCRCRDRKNKVYKQRNEPKTERKLSVTKFTEHDAIEEEKTSCYLSNGFLNADTAHGEMSETSNLQSANTPNAISCETELKSIARNENDQTPIEEDDVFIEEGLKPCADDNPVVVQLCETESSNSPNKIDSNSPIICPSCNKEIIDDEQATGSIDTDDRSFNLSTCSLMSGENYNQLNNQLKRNTRNDDSGKSGTCYSINEDGSGSETLSWTKNRSFFLRMTENRRKQHRKEWERKQNDFIFSKFAPALPREKAVQDLQVDLEKAKNKIKLQEEQLFHFSKKIEFLQGELSEHERQLAEAEMSKIIALNECKSLNEVIRSLKQRLEEKEHGDDLQSLLNLEGYPSSVSQQPKSFDRESLPIEAGDLTTASSGKELDQGYFSIPRKGQNLSPPYQLALLSPSGSSLHLSCNSMTSLSDSVRFSTLLESSGEMSTLLQAAQCQTDLNLFDAADGSADDPLIIIDPELNYHQKFEMNKISKGTRSYTILKIVSKAVLLFVVWESAHQHTLDLHIMLHRYILPTWRQ